MVKPVDLVTAINHGDGMRGGVGELLDVDESCEQALSWKEALKSCEKEDGLAALGGCNTIFL